MFDVFNSGLGQVFDGNLQDLGYLFFGGTNSTSLNQLVP